MKNTLISAVLADASLRSAESMKDIAVDLASAGAPWLTEDA